MAATIGSLKGVISVSYVFSRQKVADFKLNKYGGEEKSATYNGIDGEQTDANIIVNGVQQLLAIVGWQDKYNPTDAGRTVNERVSISD